MIDKKQFISARSEGTSKIHSARNWRLQNLEVVPNQAQSREPSNGLSFELQMEKYNVLASLVSPIQTGLANIALSCLLRIR